MIILLKPLNKKKYWKIFQQLGHEINDSLMHSEMILKLYKIIF
jgi:hypothetical protein